MTDTPTPPVEPTPPPAAAPAYAQQPYAAGPKTNVFSIISLIASVIGFSILGVIFGHVALVQIKNRGEGGHVLAIIGLVVGYLGCLGWIIWWIFFFVVIAASGNYYGFNYGY